LNQVSIDQCLPGPLDYTFQYWANGFARRASRTEPAPAPQVLCFQTGRYGLAIDVQKVQVTSFGLIKNAHPADQAVSQDPAVVLSLPLAKLSLTVEVDGRTYVCSAGAIRQDDPKVYPARLIECGRLIQRSDIQQLVFIDSLGGILPADSRLEIIAWPDRLVMVLEVIPARTFEQPKVTISLSHKDKNLSGNSISHPEKAAAGQKITATLVLRPGARDPADDAAGDGLTIEARDLVNTDQPAMAVTYDATLGLHDILLPKQKDLDALTRVALSLANDCDRPRTVRLRLRRDGGPGITGCTPMIRDADGHPTGLFVQVSKNWHNDEQGKRTLLYQGPWIHNTAIFHLPPRGRLDCEFTMAWARWGGLPAASHAQLCLIGWGHNQLWDQAALGSWGESICYEPDAVQRGCMIDDVRPLMVTSMSKNPKGRYGWTNNVGGGDFLVYHDPAGRRQFLKGVRAYYQDHGPNLTRVTYAGLTADEAIAARMDVSLGRCDDLTRVFHSFRYDVRKPARFGRLAFYQLGADRYLWFGYDKIARGNQQGLIEEWSPRKAHWAYERTGIECPGRLPWFSLHESVPPSDTRGAWANRGLIVRSWKARLGGRDAPSPYASVYGTADGDIRSAALELSAPPDVAELMPGDFVEAEVEIIIVPMAAEDYYGPNESLRAALSAGANTYQPVLREAVGNDLNVRATRGQVGHAYPLVIAVDADQSAEFEVAGGIGFVPMTFTGLTSFKGYELYRRSGGQEVRVDQGVYGNDFWQTSYDPVSRTWQRTYNVSLDCPGDAKRPVTFGFGPSTGATGN
jgi:hypothetical protein